jgi:hypothetical protein
MNNLDVALLTCFTFKYFLVGNKKINKKSLKKAAMVAMLTCIQFSALCKTIIDDDSCAFVVTSFY